MARNYLFLRSIGMYRTGPESARIQLLSLCQTSGLSAGRRISTTSWPSSKATVAERPTIIGAWDVDHARQVDLARAALRIVQEVLKQGGNAFIKLFHGPELRRFQDEADEFFEKSRLLKPKASRPEASEVYYLGLNFKM